MLNQSIGNEVGTLYYEIDRINENGWARPRQLTGKWTMDNVAVWRAAEGRVGVLNLMNIHLPFIESIEHRARGLKQKYK